jgi:hypothetical protein
VTPLKRRPPPLCNARERCLFLLYVREDWSLFFARFSPVRPFSPRVRFPYVWKIDQLLKVPVGPFQCEVHSLLGKADEWYFFEYHPTLKPFPAFPLTEMCGQYLLCMPRSMAPEEPFQLFWTHAPEQTNSGTHTKEQTNSRTRAYVPGVIGLTNPQIDRRCVLGVVRDNFIVSWLEEFKGPVDGLISEEGPIDRPPDRPPQVLSIGFAVKNGPTVRFVEPPLIYIPTNVMMQARWDVILKFVDDVVNDRDKRFPKIIGRERTENPRVGESIVPGTGRWKVIDRDPRKFEELCNRRDPMGPPPVIEVVFCNRYDL